MRQTQQMSRWLIGFVISLSTFLSGCQVGGTEAPTPAASIPPETSIPVAPPPPLLYIHQGTLLEQIGSGAPQRLMDLPGAGAVLAATRIGDVVLVLREEGLQRVMLADGSSALLLRFDLPARFGGLVPVDGTQVIYQATVDDPQAELIGTRIGLYQADSDTVRAVLSFAQSVHVLGLTADGTRLYLLPRGQDPAFVRVLVAALESGDIETELPIEGEIFATLAPDGRHLATTARRAVSADALEGVLNLYDLASRPLTPRVISLPHAPSHAWGLLWSSDSRSLYFLLRPGDMYDEPATSHGLWRLEVGSGMLSQVAAVAEAEGHLAISHDGRWVVWGSWDGTVRVWEAQTRREVTRMTAFKVDASAFSPNGQWLLLRHVHEDMAALVHLPTGVTEAFTLPAEAIVVGWR